MQAVYAKGVFDAALGVKDFNREVDFPGVAQRCDLFFQGGTGIWVELKTQRNRTDATALRNCKPTWPRPWHSETRSHRRRSGWRPAYTSCKQAIPKG